MSKIFFLEDLEHLFCQIKPSDEDDHFNYNFFELTQPHKTCL